MSQHESTDEGDFSWVKDLGLGELVVLAGIALIVFDFVTLGYAGVFVGIAIVGYRSLTAEDDESESEAEDDG